MPALFLLLFIVFAAGCQSDQTATAPQPPAARTLNIGLIPEQNLFRQMERYEPLAAYLSDKIGTPIKLTVLPRYGNIIDNFVSGGLDGAFFGSFTYALAHRKLGVQVLARPEDLRGVSTYHGLIFVRKDSGIRSIREMKEKRFAFVDKATTAGYLLPAAYFKKYGVDYRSHLKEGYFTGTHEDAINDVLNRKADIGAAKNTVFERLSLTEPRIGKELQVLEQSPRVPENALAVNKDLDEALKTKILDALLNMHRDPAGIKVLEVFGARRFIKTTDEDYGPVYRYAQAISLDLSTYDYRND